MNICLLGLSGSGKTCFLYTATHVLSKGVIVEGHTISVTSSNLQQTVRLNRGVEQMAKGHWPDNSNQTIAYPFELKIDGCPVLSFTIHDFRGNMLEGLSDDDKDNIDELFDTFERSSCVIVLVDGDTIMEALDQNRLTPGHRRQVDYAGQLAARNRLNYIEALVRECNNRMEMKVPILLTITKRDMFNSEELSMGKDFLKSLLPSVFAQRNDLIVGITAVAIGENLKNVAGRLTGTLCLNTEGNIHLPILFSLFQEIDKSADAEIKEFRKMMLKLFSKDKISFYRGGRTVILV